MRRSMTAKQAEETIQPGAIANLLTLIEQLKDTNAMLEERAHSWVHDLRGPLRNIAGFMQLIEERSGEVLDPVCREYLRFIERSVLVMQSLLDSGLAENKRSKLECLENVSMNAVLVDVKAVLMRSLIERQVVLGYKSLPQIWARRIKMVQLLQNLIQNAIKFTPSKQPHITISSKENATHWEFIVEDNGIGVPEEARDKIFALFARGASEPTIEGGGVGLAICAKIVGEHGGQIWVESSAANGAAFHFTIKKKSSDFNKLRTIG